MDYVGQDYHHPSHSHIDALCHVSYRGTLYNGFETASTVRADTACTCPLPASREAVTIRRDEPG